MKSLLLATICTLFCSPVWAEKPDNFWTKCATVDTVDVSTVYRSQYIFSNALVVRDGGVVQPDIYVTTKSGLAFDIWASAPVDLGDFNRDYGTELDLKIKYCTKVGDYNVAIAGAYYDLYQVGSVEGSDFLAVIFDVSRDFKVASNFTLSPYIKVEIDFTTDGQVGGDMLPRLGLRTCWEINKTVSLAGNAFVLYDPGIYGGDVALVGNIEASLNWKLGEHVKLELPYLQVIGPFNDVSDSRETEFVWGAGVTFSL